MVNGLLIGVNQIAVAIRRICGSQNKLIRVKRNRRGSEDLEWTGADWRRKNSNNIL